MHLECGGRKVHMRRVVSASLLRACGRFLAQELVANVLPLGDLYSPLLQVSHVYGAIERNQVVGVCTVCHPFSTSRIVLGTAPSKIKNALFRRALADVSNKFILLCQPNDIDLFKEYSTILYYHFDRQMVANPPRQVKCCDVKVKRVSKSELELLNKFYVEHHAKGWVPILFKVGPYYCVKQDGKMVSAAGVHLVTHQISQLDNIITDEAYRNRGFATACTNVLAQDLASKGRIISLFVRADNAPAIRVYEKLGFSKTREIAFLVMQKNGDRTIWTDKFSKDGVTRQ